MHFVFLEGGILSQLYRKPQVPKLMGSMQASESHPECENTPPALMDSMPVSESHLDCKNTPIALEENSPDYNDNNHNYASPIANVSSASKGTQIIHAEDHTYAEQSDVPMELYRSSDSDAAVDSKSVATGVSPCGWLIITSNDQLEISMEFQSTPTLPDETISDTLQDHQLLSQLPGATHEQNSMLPMQEQQTIETLPEAISEMLPEATTSTNSVLSEATINPPDVSPEATLVVEQPDATIKEPPSVLTDKSTGECILPDETKSNSVLEMLNKTTEKIIGEVTVDLPVSAEQLTKSNIVGKIPKVADTNDNIDTAKLTSDAMNVTNNHHKLEGSSFDDLGVIPLNVSGMQPLETSSTMSELPELCKNCNKCHYGYIIRFVTPTTK